MAIKIALVCVDQLARFQESARVSLCPDMYYFSGIVSLEIGFFFPFRERAGSQKYSKNISEYGTNLMRRNISATSIATEWRSTETRKRLSANLSRLRCVSCGILERQWRTTVQLFIHSPVGSRSKVPMRV